MPRYAAKIDNNQGEIVKALRSIPGVTVASGHDDILIGRNGMTYWFEIKDPSKIKKNGELMAGTLEKSQADLLRSWRGHYRVVWSLEQILEDIGINHV